MTFTPTDTADYNGATRERALINVQQGDADDHLGDAGRDHLRHGAERDAAGRDGAGAGHVRLHAGGGDGAGRGQQQTLTVTFTPTDTADYNGATATRDVKVQKATPVITWATPADITYGTALSATQLDATARAGHVRVHAGGGHGAGRRQLRRFGARSRRPTRPTTTTATTSVTHQRAEGDAGDHLGDAGRHHLRDGAERDAAGRDGASVPGTFVYTPAAGTVLGAGGSQTLR